MRGWELGDGGDERENNSLGRWDKGGWEMGDTEVGDGTPLSTPSYVCMILVFEQQNSWISAGY